MRSRHRPDSTRAPRTLACLAILLAPLYPQRTSAQDIPLIQQFVGAWEGHGGLFGADATFSMEWEWVLERRFVRLTFQNKMQGPDGTARILKAQAFYQSIGSGRFEGTWFDSRGMVLPLQGNVTNATLTTLWGTPETEQGRTVYRLLDENRLDVEDFVMRGGRWNRFGHAVYHRMAKTDRGEPARYPEPPL